MLRPWPLAVAITLALAGCSPSGVGPADDTDADADADADTDTDADADADADTDGCPDYSGMGDTSRTWEYVYTDVPGGTGGVTIRLSQADGYIVAHQDSWFTGEGWTYEGSGRSRHTCDDDGLWTWDSTVAYVQVAGGNTIEGSSVTVYDEPFLGLVRGIQVGTTWEVHTSGTTTSDPGGVTAFDYDVSYEVTGSETVSVEAGEFETLVLRATSVVSGTSSTSRSWLDRDVGMVRTEGMELVAVDR